MGASAPAGWAIAPCGQTGQKGLEPVQILQQLSGDILPAASLAGAVVPVFLDIRAAIREQHVYTYVCRRRFGRLPLCTSHKSTHVCKHHVCPTLSSRRIRIAGGRQKRKEKEKGKKKKEKKKKEEKKKRRKEKKKGEPKGQRTKKRREKRKNRKKEKKRQGKIEKRKEKKRQRKKKKRKNTRRLRAAVVRGGAIARQYREPSARRTCWDCCPEISEFFLGTARWRSVPCQRARVRSATVVTAGCGAAASGRLEPCGCPCAESHFETRVSTNVLGFNNGSEPK